MTTNESTWEIFNAVHAELDNPKPEAEYDTTPYRKQGGHCGKKNLRLKPGPELDAWLEERKMRPGEITYADWRKAEGKRKGLNPDTIRNMVGAGKYPRIMFRKIGRRVFVTP